ncbi:hypothetical protein NL108_017193 [Boleophthalmus pectinirostris]|nr:hypothetical protein NL108_017193 [Boleophthalmus pectinirostris]
MFIFLFIFWLVRLKLRCDLLSGKYGTRSTDLTRKLGLGSMDIVKAVIKVTLWDIRGSADTSSRRRPHQEKPLTVVYIKFFLNVTSSRVVRPKQKAKRKRKRKRAPAFQQEANKQNGK